MKLAFSHLRLSNFKAYRQLHLDLTGFAPGCHSIKGVNRARPRLGSNGAGKSTLWDALTFALYGKTPNGVRGADLVPWDNPEANPQAVLVIRVDDEERII